jgi:FSR family fosmidomycin resistance protein-like MFS transporter
LTYLGLFSFLPIIVSRQGFSTRQTGTMTPLFPLGGTSGGVCGDWLSDHLGGRMIISVSLALAFPALQLALGLQGPVAMSLLVAGGFCLLVSAPVTIALRQRYLPSSVATASSFMLAFAWRVGGLLVTLIGVRAEHIGPIAAYWVELVCLTVAAVLALFLPTPAEAASNGTEPPIGTHGPPRCPAL